MRRLSGSASSSSSDGGVVHATASLLPRADASDACLWAPGLACGVPRSCFDCLNAPSIKGQCTLDPLGRCVSILSYEPSSDFRRRDNASDALFYYPSTAASYCDASDTTCAACRGTLDATGWYFRSPRDQNYTPFCVGADGCICVATCEAPARNASVLALCSSQIASSYARQSTVYMVAMIVASVLFVTMFVFSAKWSRRQYPRDDLDIIDRPRRRVREPTGPSLELTGWHSMREKLIADEEAAAQARERRRHGEESIPTTDPTNASGA